MAWKGLRAPRTKPFACEFLKCHGGVQVSEEIPEEAAPAAPAPAAPLSPAEAKVQRAMEVLGRAMASVQGEDKNVLATLKSQTEQAARLSGAEFDKRLEFCYAIVFSPELSTNARIQSAAQAYIDAVKAMQDAF